MLPTLPQARNARTINTRDELTFKPMSGAHPLEQAIEYIRAHGLEIKTLRSVAQKFSVDPGNLARAFRLKEGVTAKQFIDEKKKLHVLARLESNSHLYYEIGYEVGFTKDYAFSRWAKPVFGVSLTELQGKRGRRKK